MKLISRKLVEETTDNLNCLLSPLIGKVTVKDVAICTIHGNTPSYSGDFAIEYAWPEIQTKQLRKHTPEGYQIYAYGNKIIPEHEEFLKQCAEVTYISSKSVRNGEFEHVWPLRNWLTRLALRTHKIIIHLDSDAFPVHDDWLGKYTSMISVRSPVIAVKRLENGDTHSDRCFLMFSKKGFKRHAFDFSKIDAKDSGGGISKDLELNNYHWHALVRSNKYDYHPVIAGIYDDCIYHHAAGSREPRLRANILIQKNQSLWETEKKIHKQLMKRLFKYTDVFISELRGTTYPYDFNNDAIESENIMQQRTWI